MQIYVSLPWGSLLVWWRLAALESCKHLHTCWPRRHHCKSSEVDPIRQTPLWKHSCLDRLYFKSGVYGSGDRVGHFNTLRQDSSLTWLFKYIPPFKYSHLYKIRPSKEFIIIPTGTHHTSFGEDSTSDHYRQLWRLTVPLIKIMFHH